ncbi:MAG: Eco57I restriction-modification methylase domain-containing protein [Gemmatimonadaceae bacterium]
MPTLSLAASLLAQAAQPDGLAAIARMLGFHGDALPLDENALAALGIDGTLDAHIAVGEGTLRALLLRWPADTPLRDRIALLVRRLAVRGPQLLWMAIAIEDGGAGLAIASWSGDPRPRVSALVVDRRSILPTDAESICALAAIAGTSDVLAHARWLDVLGRDALTRRFYRALERVVDEIGRTAKGCASEEERAEIALLHVSRLLFLSFLQCKGWLDGDRAFLEHGFDKCMERGGSYHRRVLEPLLFGTLNTPIARRARAARALGRLPFLNGGLFSRTPVERRRRSLQLTDDALGALFGGLLTRYRFTATEATVSWSEASIDPEMLGKAFESLMASRERRASGSFYTPHALVERVTRAALSTALADGALDDNGVRAALEGAKLPPEQSAALRRRARALRLLDPACGSGAFLVHALETVASLVQTCGDPRPTAQIRRDLLTRSIFGVDVNATAVWLCELRLWLSVVIESGETDPDAVTPLPNLDRHVRVGDALEGDSFGDLSPRRGSAEITRLRQRYAAATGARKRELERLLDRSERMFVIRHTEDASALCTALRRDLLGALRSRDLFGARDQPTAVIRQRLAGLRTRQRELRAMLDRLRRGGALPFAFPTHFPDAGSAGGFDLVLGNPPWVRLHRIPRSRREALKRRFEVFSQAAWHQGTGGTATAGFAAQVDLSALFVERASALTRPDGTLALLLPAKLWRSLAGGGVRRLVQRDLEIVALDDWTDAPPSFEAAVYPSLLVARRRPVSGEGLPRNLTVTLHRRESSLRWSAPADALGLDADRASPWITAPPPIRAAFDRMRRAGVSLSESPLGRPLLGVKCGCNEAFLVSSDANGHPHRDDTAIEREMLRPVLRGEHMQAWRPAACDDTLLWTHDRDGRALERLPPGAARWLAPWRHRLSARSDVRGGLAWWSLFRVASASHTRSRVVWADFGMRPRACVLEKNDPAVPLNSCYVLPCATPDDAYAFAALLNSPLAAAWLALIAEPARGGYHRYLAWTVSLLPIPADWLRARDRLAPLARAAWSGDVPPDSELVSAACRAYRVRPADMAPLLAWSAR